MTDLEKEAALNALPPSVLSGPLLPEHLTLVDPKLHRMVQDAWDHGEEVPFGVALVDCSPLSAGEEQAAVEWRTERRARRRALDAERVRQALALEQKP